MYILLDRIIKIYISPNSRRSVYFTIILLSILLIIFLGVYVVKSNIHRGKTNLGLAVICGYLSLGVVYYLPFVDEQQFQQQSAIPELVCSIDDSTVSSGGAIKSYFRIEKWPFVMTSAAYTEVSNDVRLQSKVYFDLDQYTFFICYGVEITEVEFNFSNAHNGLFFPWNGLVTSGFFSYGESAPGKILIYRIPKVAVDTVS